MNDLYLVLLIKLVNKGMIGISEDNVAATLMKRINHFSKLNMIVLIKLFFGISLEIRIFGYGKIRRIQKYKIARLSIVFKNKYIITAENIRLTKCFGSKSQSINITYLRILILAKRSIELPTPVHKFYSDILFLRQLQLSEVSASQENEPHKTFRLYSHISASTQ